MSQPTLNATTDPRDTPLALWSDTRRIEQWAGEARVNAIRLLAILAFYARHLADVFHDVPGSRGPYHTRVTAIVVAWIATVVIVHYLLLTRRVSPRLKYVTVAADLLAVTLLAMSAPVPPRPTLVALYLAIIASTPLRLSLGLVYAATLGAWAGYALTLIHYAWFVVGFDRYYATPELRIPRGEEAAWLLLMGTVGLFAGQSVRQARRLASTPPVSIAAEAQP